MRYSGGNSNVIKWKATSSVILTRANGTYSHSTGVVRNKIGIPQCAFVIEKSDTWPENQVLVDTCKSYKTFVEAHIAYDFESH